MPVAKKTLESSLDNYNMKMTDDGIEFELSNGKSSKAAKEVIDEELDDELIADDDEEEDDEELEDDDELEDEDEDEEEEEVEVSSKRRHSDGLSSLRKEIDSRLTRMETMIATLAKGGGGSKEEEDEDLPEEIDNKSLLKIVEKRVGKVIDSKLAPHEESMKAVNMRQQFDAAYAKHGEPFKRAARAVAKLIMDSNGTLTVEQAYTDLKEYIGEARPTKKLRNRKEVVRRARQTRVDADDESVIDTNDFKPSLKKGRSIKDSINMAIHQLSRGERY